MKLSRYEQETTINFNEEEATASVYTHNKKLIQKLTRLSQKCPGKIIAESKGHGAASFTIPKGCVSIREPYSDARRAADSKRAKETQIRPPNRSIRSISE